MDAARLPEAAVAPPVGTPTPEQPTPIDAASVAGARPGRAGGAKPAAGLARTHTVAAGETAMAITRKFGIKLSALQAANPGANLSRLRPGQVLNLPSP